ncbi:response regulator transcription factor [Dehalogenimonas etheniformans]|uniref:DNA-binding response regulator n=1 Tax=Dehalogenimonas etheniformans TaxID=1536648 RepID=A0A2P5PA24_9CHLR|nr:response regulator transcription factor [Dehalogenimonas etheniformans]PPD59159.1 DNA-binding response regulator [Dehalogenimonas etheniformans]QNT75797.1 response regulator transcription factor [Dehalogenimonas etheniformans]
MNILVVDSHRDETEITISAIKVPWPDAQIIRCTTGNLGLIEVGHSDFDLIIVDLELPDMSGFDFLEMLFLHCSKPTIVLKRGLLESDEVRSLQLGADECLSKPIAQLDLIAKCQAVFRRYIGREDVSSITSGRMRLEADVHRAFVDRREVALTRNENIIMYRLMQNAGRITTYNNVAHAIWGNNVPGASAAIRMCVQRLRKKLCTDDITSVRIVTERGIGFRLVLAK